MNSFSFKSQKCPLLQEFFFDNPVHLEYNENMSLAEDKTPSHIKCWEFFQCNEKTCPAFKSKDIKCWLFSGTHCRDEIQGKFLEKLSCALTAKRLNRTTLRPQ